jgi:NAD(P)H dehydrogenase (quinone)
MSIIVIYHSGYGHTKKLAEAVLQGVQSSYTQPTEMIVIDAEGNIPADGWDKLKNASAIIFGSPTYMGSCSWQFKKFADASSKPWMKQDWKNKLAAGFTNSASINGDKYNTLHYMITLAMQHSMLWAGMDILPANSKAATRNDPNYLGSFAGLMSQSPSDSSPEEGPLPGDLETARLFGQRIAKLVIDQK